MKSIDDLPPMNIETAASMQEQLARRDHRIAVLEAIVAAKTARIAELEAREGGFRAKRAKALDDLAAMDASLIMDDSGPKSAPPSNSLALSRAIAADKPLDAYGRR